MTTGYAADFRPEWVSGNGRGGGSQKRYAAHLLELYGNAVRGGGKK